MDAGAGPVVAANRVRVADEAVRVGQPQPADHPTAPKIHLVREDGVVRAIDVVCSCGERIRILCEYS